MRFKHSVGNGETSQVLQELKKVIGSSFKSKKRMKFMTPSHHSEYDSKGGQSSGTKFPAISNQSGGLTPRIEEKRRTSKQRATEKCGSISSHSAVSLDQSQPGRRGQRAPEQRSSLSKSRGMQNYNSPSVRQGSKLSNDRFLTNIYGSRNKSSPKYPAKSPLPPRHERIKEEIGYRQNGNARIGKTGDPITSSTHKLESDELIEGQFGDKASSNSPAKKSGANFHLYINKKTRQISMNKKEVLGEEEKQLEKSDQKLRNSAERVLLLKFASQRKSLELEDRPSVSESGLKQDLKTPSFAAKGSTATTGPTQKLFDMRQCSISQIDLPPPQETSISVDQSSLSPMRHSEREKKLTSSQKQSIQTQRQSRRGAATHNQSNQPTSRYSCFTSESQHSIPQERLESETYASDFEISPNKPLFNDITISPKIREELDSVTYETPVPSNIDILEVSPGSQFQQSLEQVDSHHQPADQVVIINDALPSMQQILTLSPSRLRPHFQQADEGDEVMLTSSFLPHISRAFQQWETSESREAQKNLTALIASQVNLEKELRTMYTQPIGLSLLKVAPSLSERSAQERRKKMATYQPSFL